MTAQALGTHFHFFTGEVRDIQDPNNSGKHQLHIHGHTNQQNPPMDDSELHWGHPVMNNSQSVNGIGHTTRYQPGSSVVGFWADPLTKQIPIILGSLHKAGITSGGGGDIEPNNIDNSYRSPPRGPNETTLDPGVLGNATKVQQQDLLKKSDYNWGVAPAGEQQAQEGSQNNAQKIVHDQKDQANPDFIKPNNPNHASAKPNKILQAIKSVDPGNQSGAVKKSLDATILLNQIAGLTSSGGAADMAAGALGQALQSVAGSMGLSSVLSAVSTIASQITDPQISTILNTATTGLLTNSGVGSLSAPVITAAQSMANAISAATSNGALGGNTIGLDANSVAYAIATANAGSTFTINTNTANGATIQLTITISQNVSGSQISDGTASIPSFTGTEIIDIAMGQVNAIANTISSAIKNKNLNLLIGLVESLFANVQNQGIKSVLGVDPSNILGSIQQLIPMVAGNIQSTIDNLPRTVNIPQNIIQLQQDTSVALSLAKKCWDIAHMFGDSGASSTAGVANALSGAIENMAAGATQALSTTQATIVGKVLKSAGG